MTLADDTMQAWLNTFRAAGKAPGTIRNRQSYIGTMAKELDPLAINADELNDYLASRDDLAPESRKSMIIAMRSFYRFAHRRGLIAEDLALELPSVHVPPPVSTPVPHHELMRARLLADPITEFALDLGSRAGLRASEITRVHQRDIGRESFLVLGKGGRIREVPIHPMLSDRMRAIKGWAFPSPVRSGLHVGYDFIANRIEAVLPEPYTTHSLRHYFANEAYDATGDIRAVQELLGHASVETTQRYLRSRLDKLHAAVRAVA